MLPAGTNPFNVKLNSQQRQITTRELKREQQLQRYPLDECVLTPARACRRQGQRLAHVRRQRRTAHSGRLRCTSLLLRTWKSSKTSRGVPAVSRAFPSAVGSSSLSYTWRRWRSPVDHACRAGNRLPCKQAEQAVKCVPRLRQKRRADMHVHAKKYTHTGIVAGTQKPPRAQTA